MKGYLWDPGKLAPGMIALFGLLGAAVVGWVVTIIQHFNQRIEEFKADTRVARFYLTALPLLAGNIATIVLWVFVAASTGAARSSILAAIAGAASAITGANFVWTLALAIDAQRIDLDSTVGRYAMTLVIWVQRIAFFAIAFVLAYETAVARGHIASVHPLVASWTKWLWVVTPLCVVRTIESIIRPLGADSTPRPAEQQGLYERLRRWYLVPSVFTTLAMLILFVYFFEVANLPTGSTVTLAAHFGTL
jgi:hypothetical protein